MRRAPHPSPLLWLALAAATTVLALEMQGYDARADILVLRGGTRIDGELLSYDQKAQELRFRLSDGGVLTLKRADVESLTVSSPAPAAPSAAPAAPPVPAPRRAGPIDPSEILKREASSSPSAPGRGSPPPSSSLPAAPAPSADPRQPVWVPVPERRPLNGAEIIASPEATGLGSLTIVNGLDVDALVKLFDPVARTVPRAIYIRARNEATLTDVARGSYRARFASGSEWDSRAHDFRRGAHYSEFSRPVIFTETETETAKGTETTYARITLTLHRVPGGTARTTAIDRARFREGDPP
jgi:hypothetical protein